MSEKFERAVERGREVDALRDDPRVEIAAQALSRGKLPESLHLHSDARAVVEALFPSGATWRDKWIIDLERQRDELREELRARRACLVGARETVDSVASTLAWAESLESTREALAGPLKERIDLLDQAIAQTDAALGESSP